jgi:hypothetical protein
MYGTGSPVERTVVMPWVMKPDRTCGNADCW